ncbi:arylsulfotransferase [Aspergillus piperis CBS 112811]|uniref:Arylsulfotransferase n=1 Tax=Aspergillus piperis CBS 112811 TaxID=1448313 RepID=A0A8G1R6W8_9EURO|nr:arylsulfotransferase [Aspergillus piperis CBS 112811]RAH60609.1 arylsulfotransferase [Aspergillus piperis CBS 112811]
MIPGTLTVALAAFLFLASALADVGPYFDSELYEQGRLGSWPIETYRSTSTVGAAVNFLQYGPQCRDDKYYFISPRGYSVHKPGPMILDHKGRLIWTKPYGNTYNFNVYNYKGQDYLTFWVGDDGKVGHGEGTYYMLDSSYQEAFTLSGANGLAADLHEFHITLDETAVYTIYDIRPADIRVAGGPEKGWIWDGTFQEVNIETNELLFEWRASEHFDIADVYRGREGSGEDKERPWDYFHINSIDKDAKGNFLVSARYCNCLIYIDGHTGETIWTLGGKRSNFTDLSGGAATNFTWQHHARFRDNGTAITLLDNSSRGRGAPQYPSRGLYLDIDETNMTVQVRHEYWNEYPIKSQSQGSIQILDSGNVLVGYGFSAAWTEFSMDGEVLCHAHFAPGRDFHTGKVVSYRTFKHPWVGKPNTLPDFEVYAYRAAASWNGATEVSHWVLEGTNEKISETAQPTFLSAVPKDGFETVIPIPNDTKYKYLRVRAVSAKGETLAASKLARWDPTSNEAVVVSGDSDDPFFGDRDKIYATFIFLTIALFSTAAIGAFLWFGVKKGYLMSWLRSRRRDDKDKERGTFQPLKRFGGDEDLSDVEVEDSVEFSALLGDQLLGSGPDVERAGSMDIVRR